MSAVNAPSKPNNLQFKDCELFRKVSLHRRRGMACFLCKLTTWLTNGPLDMLENGRRIVVPSSREISQNQLTEPYPFSHSSFERMKSYD
jgi:hypothetical protein